MLICVQTLTFVHSILMKVISRIFFLLVFSLQINALATELFQKQQSDIAIEDLEYCVVECDNLSFILPVDFQEDDLEHDTEEEHDFVWIIDVELDDKPSIEQTAYFKFHFIETDRLELAFTFSSFSEKYFTPPDFV